MKKRRGNDGKEEEKKPIIVSYFSCTCGVFVTGDTYDEVEGKAISHKLMFHTNRVYRPDSRLMLRGV